MQGETVDCAELARRFGGLAAPIVVDVRTEPDLAADPVMLPGSFRGDPERLGSWSVALPPGAQVIVYCAHGGAVSQNAAAALRGIGLEARSLAGGVEAWRAQGGPLVAAREPPRLEDKPSAWVTRERPKIDRIACPWLIRRFVDPRAVFLYVPVAEVERIAETTKAVPYDVSGAEFGHHGELCSFDSFISRFGIVDAALDRLAAIVRGADTGRPDLTPQSAGLLAMSHGLSVLCPNDHAMLERGMLFYDALYAWCRSQGPAEKHAS